MFRWLMLKVGGAWLLSQLRAIGEGKRGGFLKGLYDFLTGQKVRMAVGVVFAGGCIVAATLDCVKAAAAITAAAGFLVTAGFIDSNWRKVPESWESYAGYQFLRNHWADIVWFAAGLTSLFTTCDPSTAEALARVHLTCRSAVLVVGGAVGFLGWALSEARLAKPPSEV